MNALLQPARNVVGKGLILYRNVFQYLKQLQLSMTRISIVIVSIVADPKNTGSNRRSLGGGKVTEKSSITI